MAKKYDDRHGGPFDRGGADSYYRRGFHPHFYRGDTYTSERVEKLTQEELEAYAAGYQENEAEGEFEDYG